MTSGKPQLIETIAKAGIAWSQRKSPHETHPNPSKAKSDGANMPLLTNYIYCSINANKKSYNLNTNTLPRSNYTEEPEMNSF